MDVNETKLANAAKARALRPAQVEEIRAAGMEPGYGSPIGAHDTLRPGGRARGPLDRISSPAPTARASTTATSTSAATTRPTSSPTSRTPARDDGCPTCGAPVILRNGIEVGNIFKLGTKYTTRPRRHVPRRGRDGSPDRDGLVRDRRGAGRSPASSRRTTTRRGSPGRRRWRRTRPTSSPSPRRRTRASPRSPSGSTTGRSTAGREVLWDDRDESPGVKFTDAELLGMPLIVTISPRSLAAGGAEVTVRATGERTIEPLEAVEARLRPRAAAGRNVDGHAPRVRRPSRPRGGGRAPPGRAAPAAGCEAAGDRRGRGPRRPRHALAAAEVRARPPSATPPSSWSWWAWVRCGSRPTSRSRPPTRRPTGSSRAVRAAMVGRSVLEAFTDHRVEAIARTALEAGSAAGSSPSAWNPARRSWSALAADARRRRLACAGGRVGAAPPPADPDRVHRQPEPRAADAVDDVSLLAETLAADADSAAAEGRGAGGARSRSRPGTSSRWSTS